ncbi:MAG: IgGFc-binding protein [Labilithrix sp.]|nr:IgGFc-binding protein [Labilithrix sp.]MCW5831683.1 IgGFc-binding protein [Labilithrix sp.]
MKAARAALVVTATLGACATSGESTLPEPVSFPSDGGAPDESCLLQCSVDFRSVVRSCDGSIVETCPDDLACGDGACVEPCRATALAKSSLGCEFYLQPPSVRRWGSANCYAAYLVNASSSPVDVTLHRGDEAIDVTEAVYRMTPDAELEKISGPIPPGEAAIVFVAHGPRPTPQQDHVACPVPPALDQWPIPFQTARGASFRLTTSAPVSAATIYPYGGAESYIPSSTLLLPVPGWGKQHVVVQAWQRMLGRVEGGVPTLQIVAAEDDTEVNLVPIVDVQDGDGVVGGAKGARVTYRLGKGELLQLAQAEELSGSRVDANKPIALFGGHECMFIPSDVGYCDTAQQQIPSFEQWGSEYVAVRYRGRASDTESVPYRIVAAVADTALTYDPEPPPGAPSRMSAGDVVTFWTGAPFVVRSQDADHPFYLASYMTGGDNVSRAGPGDPEFVNVVPAGQYLNAYTFFADPTYAETSLVLVRERTETGFEDVWLECAGGIVDGWTPVGNGGKFEYRRVDLSRSNGPGETFPNGTCGRGLQRLTSKGPFTATLWGWAAWASYAYPGGMAQRKLVSRPLDVH